MIDSITRITLNLQETNTMVSIRAKRGDTGRKLLIHLSDGSIPYHISDDCYATFTAKKPDGTKINNACTIENNVIEYEFTDQTCTAVGTMKAEIRLYGADDKMITSACFLVNVYDTVFRDGDEVGSETEMNTLDDLILRANAFLNETGKLLRWQGNWDSETEYEANDLVLHEEVLYVAEEAITAGTAPGSEEVTAWVPIAGMGTGSGGEVVGIESVTQTTVNSTPGGTNVITVKLTDGTESEIKIRNGVPGASVQGPQGPAGPMGPMGPRGYTGGTGPQGPAGADGAKGDKGDKGDTGQAGAQGAKGDKGDVGATPNLSIGEVTTLSAGMSATATITGTAENPVLNLGIPKGADGNGGSGTGGTGADSVGIRSVQQTTASTEDEGINVITVTKTDGTSSTFEIRNGSKGSKGDPGAKGDKGDTGATGETGPQGPKGDTGATGSQGPKGDTGATGPKGEAGYTPIRGTDYWTDSDKAEIQTYVENAILGGAW